VFQITLMVWLKASDSTLFDSYDIIINNGNNSYKCLVINLGDIYLLHSRINKYHRVTQTELLREGAER
jgi:hypothetical protein